MLKKEYCTQNNGDCETCSLVNYGRDCHNNFVGRGGYRGGIKPTVADKAKNRTIRLNDADHALFICKGGVKWLRTQLHND